MSSADLSPSARNIGRPLKMAVMIVGATLSHIFIRLAAIVALAACWPGTAMADEAATSQPAGSNEDTKVELSIYYEFKPSTLNVLATLGANAPVNGLSRDPWTVEFYDVGSYGTEYPSCPSINIPISSGTSTTANSWLISPVQEAKSSVYVNRVYRTPILLSSNVEQYRVHLSVPTGYEVYNRLVGSTDPFVPGSILSSNVFGAAAFEYVIVRIGEGGALAGKCATGASGTGEMRLALGFLPNGKSAGYIDFLPSADYMPWAGITTLQVDWGRPLGAANLRCVNLTEQVQVVTMPVPSHSGGNYLQQPATAALRQVIAPQALIDISMDGSDLLVKYFSYNPDQMGVRMVSEYNSATQSNYTYPSGKGPYTPVGSPFVVYRIQHLWAVNGTNISMTTNVTRTEGAKSYVSSWTKSDTYNDYTNAGPWILEEDPNFDENWLITCPNCGGSGVVGCDVCSLCGGTGAVPIGDGMIWVPGDPGYVGLPTSVTSESGFGRYRTIYNATTRSGQAVPEGGSSTNYVTYNTTRTQVPFGAPGGGSIFNTSIYYDGAFPSFNNTYQVQGDTGIWYARIGAVQKLKSITDGNGAVTKLSYYRTYSSDPLHDTHHGRIKYREDGDGRWTMYDYDTNLSSLGQVTKIVSPVLDTVRPSELPASAAAVGYRITNTSYTEDWEGVRRLPESIWTSVSGSTVQLSYFGYATDIANGEPVWRCDEERLSDSSWTYAELSSTAIYEGRLSNGTPVSSWLRGLPYTSLSGYSRESVAYHRGNYDASSRLFTKNSSGRDFRSVVLKGPAYFSSPAIIVSTYDGTGIEPLPMIPNISVAEVTIRDRRGFTLRSETLLFKGSSNWMLIDYSDMQYDAAGNLTRRQKFNGALYEAVYIDGQKTSEKDEQGLTTSFYYDSEGRVSYTVREAFGSVPAMRTSFTYDDENRILSTKIGNEGSEQIVSSKTYDRSGRVLTDTSQGLTTTYVYTVENDILTRTTITLPGGATQILENYRDGRLKSATGTASIAEFYHYGVEDDHETVTVYKGSDNSARWTKTHADWLGHTVKTESSSTGGALVSNSTYNEFGQLTSAQTDTLAPTDYLYDGNGVMNQYAQADRKNSFSYGYRTDGNVWSRYGGDTSTLWDYSETKAYPTGVPAGQIQTRTWTRVTNFNRVSGPPGVTGVAIAESVAADANDNRAVTQTFLDRDNAKVTTVVWSPFAAQPSISIAVAGRLISQTSSAGVTVTYGYDALGRATSTTDRTGTSTVAYESGKTRLQSVTDARGVTQHTYTYDAAGRLSRDQTPRIVNGSVSGTNSSYFAYNTRGQLTHIWGDVPYPVKYDYNGYGDRTGQTTYRDGSTDWSASNLAISGWPGSGDTTIFAYFASNGLLNTKTDPANKTVTYTYNKRGQLTTRQWARGTTTTYAYNDGTTGDLSSATYSDGTPSLSYAYDQLGRTQTIQDGTGTRSFAYRTADLKPASETFSWPGLSATRQLINRYDPTTGRLIGFSLDNAGTSEHALAYGFDPVNGRLKTITSGAGVFRYSYLANSNLISGVTRGYYSQSRSYEDHRNVLTNLSTATQTGTIAAYTYASDDIGRRTTVDQSGVVYDPYTLGTQLMRTAYGYNNRNEVTSAGTTVASTPLPARSFGYAFDPIGNRTQDSLDGTVSSYSANNLNQYTSRGTPGFIPVTGTANKTGGASLTIDGNTVTNWTNNYFYHGVTKNGATTPFYQSFAFNASSGGLSQAETVWSAIRPVTEAFTYDDDGNLLSDSLWVYRYDGENRLISMHARVARSGQQPVAVRFAHDYMGRRVSKEVLTFTGTAEVPSGYTAQSKTLFVYQGWTLLAEYDVSLNLQRRFTFGIDLSGSLGGAGDIGGLLAIEDLRLTNTRGTYLSAFDGNGNLMALTDGATGGLAAAYEYDPFGNALRATGSYGKENPFRFAGKYFDQETGLSFYGFRYYYASTGRFVNRDLLEERGGWNLYSGIRLGAANPFAGMSGVERTSWSTEWEQAQSRLLSNTSLPHTTQAVTFFKKNSGLPGASGSNQKIYTANATGHYAQGGAPGTSPQAPFMSGSNPGAGNADINLYAYAGNNPINQFDMMGLYVKVTRNGNDINLNFPMIYLGPNADAATRQRVSKAIESAWTRKVGDYNVTTKVTDLTDRINNNADGTYSLADGEKASSADRALFSKANGITLADGAKGSRSHVLGTDRGVWYTNIDGQPNPDLETTVKHEAGHLAGLPDLYIDEEVDGIISSVVFEGCENLIMGSSKSDGISEEEIANIIIKNKRPDMKATEQDYERAEKFKEDYETKRKETQEAKQERQRQRERDSQFNRPIIN